MRVPLAVHMVVVTVSMLLCPHPCSGQADGTTWSGPHPIDIPRTKVNSFVLQNEPAAIRSAPQVEVKITCLSIPTTTISGHFESNIVDAWMEIATRAETQLSQLLAKYRYVRFALNADAPDCMQESSGMRRAVALHLLLEPDISSESVDWVELAIREGYSLNYCDCERYVKAEQVARADKRGIWGKPLLLETLQNARMEWNRKRQSGYTRQSGDTH